MSQIVDFGFDISSASFIYLFHHEVMTKQDTPGNESAYQCAGQLQLSMWTRKSVQCGCNPLTDKAIFFVVEARIKAEDLYFSHISAALFQIQSGRKITETVSTIIKIPMALTVYLLHTSASVYPSDHLSPIMLFQYICETDTGWGNRVRKCVIV